ncbi:MAG: bifunctional adenosylcobinamide kinase/adenosylcobinamide-phosphate guanylyltransferase [Clostridia bacterium]|nr:bifunctional adenosylcobinamide kinase/adenosylcobinamide-phosphate guanylyltransferase [Clostridia bacterium]
MFILLTGGVRSGKSTLAARMLETFPQEKHYIATMRVSDEECAERVRLHRLAREGKGYVTHECPTGLAELRLPNNVAVILDCLPNLLSNEMFEKGWEEDPSLAAENAAARILRGIRSLAERSAFFVIITNDTGGDGIIYDPATRAYVRALSRLNREVAALSDAAAQMSAGIPIFFKGGEELLQNASLD